MKNIRIKGNLIAASALIAIAVGVLILGISSVVRTNTLNLQYLQELNKTYFLCESAINEALGKVSRNASIMLDPDFSSWKQRPQDQTGGALEFYKMEAHPVTFPDPLTGGQRLGTYVVASATRTTAGKSFMRRLHAYAVTSNVGDYFLAVKTGVVVSTGIDAIEGKIYGSSLVFVTDGVYEANSQTHLKRAEYFNVCESSDIIPQPGHTTACDATDFSTDVDLAEPAGINRPIKLDYELVFPELTDMDMGFYRTKAHFEDNPAGHYVPVDCQFTGDIFPPGYSGGKLGGDNYPNHSNDNFDHVYFCEGSITLNNVTVHGQVLFVSTGNIHINGNLRQHNAETYNEDEMDSDRPGVGLGASTAHQAILITRKNVVIDSSDIGFEDGTNSISTRTIEGMIMVPIGELIASQDADISKHKRRKLNFHGAWIAKNMNTTIPIVFNCDIPAGPPSLQNRTYKYMDSLRSHPPPDLPNIAEMYYMFEDQQN